MDWQFHPGIDDGHAVSAPVGAYRPNDFGLHDMHGNVSEWCADAIVRYDNPVLPGTGQRQLEPGREPRHGEMLDARVHRGGSCQAMAAGLRSARRGADQVGMRLPSIGVRPARLLAR
jgi:formylglycine-generating enzyme required for sulfatase activity